MSVSASSVNWHRVITTGTTSHQITLPTARPSANSSIVLGFQDRTGGAVINGVADSVNGAWGAHVSTYTRGTNLSRVYVFPASASGTPTITVTTNASQNSQLVAGWIEGTSAPPTVDAVATVAEISATTNFDSNTAAATAAGGIVGFLETNNAQAAPPTMDGAGESNLNGTLAGMRSFAFFEQYGSAGSYGFEATLTAASGAFHVVAFEEVTGAPPPSVTDVNGDEEVESNDTGNVITGTDFDSATVEIEQADGPVEQDITAQGATSITFDNVFDTGSPHLKYGSATLAVINTDDQSDTIAITLTAPADTNFVDLTSINPDPDLRITAIPDLAIGDQLQWGNVQGGAIADVTVNDDATFSIEPAVTAFDVRAWDATTAEWGDWATQTIVQEFTSSGDLPRNRRRRGMLIPIWGRG